MRNLFSFDTLITPTFIHFVYWLGVAVAVLAADLAAPAGVRTRPGVCAVM